MRSLWFNQSLLRVAFAALIGATIAHTPTQALTFTLTPAQDTYTSESSPTATPGGPNGTTLSYRTNPGGTNPRHDITAIQFDISTVSGVITNSSITLTQDRENVQHQLNLLGVFDSVLGDWDEATAAYATSVPDNAVSAPWLFTDSDITEAGEYQYDQWDLVADGDTSPTFRPGVVELQGTAGSSGLTVPAAAIGDQYAFDDSNISSFLQQAVNNGDSTVTFLIASRTINLSTIESKEGAQTSAEMPTLAIETIDTPPTQFEINRNTGAISLTNVGTGTLLFDGYELESASLGALDQAGWKSIADNYDSDGPNTADGGANIGSVDADDNWTKLSQAGSDSDLSEFEFGGNGGMLGAGQSIVLSTGGAWIQTNDEGDLSASLALPDGTVIPVPVVYTGNGDSALLRGDFDADGDVDVDDFEILRQNNPDDLSALSIAQAYKQGDIDGDGDNDGADFILFRSDFNAANGVGAFASMLAGTPVPEPSGLAIVAGLCSLALVGRRKSHDVLTKKSIYSMTNRILTTCVLCLFMVSGSARAITIVPAAADTTLIEHASDTVAGDGGLNVRSSTRVDVERHELAMVRFDLSLLPSIKIVSASLNLTANRTSGDYQLTSFGLPGSVAGNWSDLTTTYNNAPGVHNDLGDLPPPVEQEQPTNIRQETDLGASDLQAWDLVSFDGQTSDVTQLAVINADQTLDVTSRFESPATADFLNNMIENRVANNNSASFIVARDVSTATGQFKFYSTEAGPSDPLFEPHLELVLLDEVPHVTANTVTGEVRFVNPTASPVDFAQYDIGSPMGNLLTGDSDWLSLADDGRDAVDGPDGGTTVGDSQGETWQESGQIGSGTLAELFLLGNSTVSAGSFISLGNAYDDTALVDDEDMTFSYFDIGLGEIVESGVILVSTAALDGDYNNDGMVNLADYTVWRDNLGSSISLPGDTTPGAVTTADYTVWKNNFGATSGAGSLVSGPLTAVPEPSSILLLATMAAGLYGVNRFRPSAAVVRAAFAMLVVALASQSVLAATDDRLYSFGEDGFENGNLNDKLGLNGPGGRTVDTVGPTGGFVDLDVFGNPTYASVSDRPGAGGGDLGASFGGAGDYLSTPVSGSSPDGMWDNPIHFDEPTTFPKNYNGIFAHGMQLWVKPNSATQNTRQDIVLDTAENGIYISNTNTWGLQFDDVSVTSSSPVSFNNWTHVMALGGASDLVTGTSGQRGILYVDGVAVTLRNSTYETSAAELVVGANVTGDGNFYHGILDDLSFFLWGDTSSEAGPPAGEDYGVFNLAEDNEWIAAELASLGVTDAADANLDGSVTPADVATLANGWKNVQLVNGVQAGDWNSRQNGDLNWDGIVDIRDAVILDQGLSTAGFGGLNFGALQSSNIPEPNSILLIALAAGGMLMARVR